MFTSIKGYIFGAPTGLVYISLPIDTSRPFFSKFGSPRHTKRKLSLRGQPDKRSSQAPRTEAGIWLWLKIKEEGLRRFWPMIPLTRVPCWYWFFEPQPFGANMFCDALWFPLFCVAFQTTRMISSGVNIKSIPGSSNHPSKWAIAPQYQASPPSPDLPTGPPPPEGHSKDPPGEASGVLGPKKPKPTGAQRKPKENKEAKTGEQRGTQKKSIGQPTGNKQEAKRQRYGRNETKYRKKIK